MKLPAAMLFAAAAGGCNGQSGNNAASQPADGTSFPVRFESILTGRRVGDCPAGTTNRI